MDGAVHTYKARLVAKGFTQTPGIDYEETFSPVADIRAIRILIAIAAFYDYEIWQMDVKTAFLNGYLNEEVYMEQPEGFVNPKYPNRVCKLKRSIYGLKQASRQWNKRFDDEIKKFGFSQNRDEPCVYMKASGSYVTFLILYVDDILIMGNNIPMLQDVKSYLGRCFAMKDLGEAAYILGIKIYRDRSKRLIGLCQSAYIEKILKRYFMENSKRGTIPMQEKLKLSKSQGASTPAEKQRMQNIPYASAVGSIMYAVRCTRPDVAFAQNMTSRFQQNLELKVSCYTDAGYLTDVEDLKSQTGYVFVLNRGVVDKKSTKQSIFATSSTDAEYIAAFDASKEAVWIQKFISELGVVPTIEEHIIYYLRETIEMGDVRIEKVNTDDNLADPFTKALAFLKHSKLTKKSKMIPRLAIWGSRSYARAMIVLQADVKLKDNIFVAMPKLTRKGYYICNVRVEYEWKSPRCASCVPVGPKIGFKPQKEYRPAPKKSTTSSSVNKKKGVVPTIEVSNSNPFEVLNLVDKDGELGTNEGTTKLINNGATSSGSSFMNVDNNSTRTTPISNKIGKFEELLTSGQPILVDEAGNPLKNVVFSSDYDSEDEVASVDNDMACSSFRKDPYDDDMYEGRDLPQELQAICDNLDIRVRSRKKK
ncbi:retrotransposon protein, putative, ty1-copia subclass [Tanacetum coccineum]